MTRRPALVLVAAIAATLATWAALAAEPARRVLREESSVTIDLDPSQHLRTTERNVRYVPYAVPHGPRLATIVTTIARRDGAPIRTEDGPSVSVTIEDLASSRTVARFVDPGAWGDLFAPRLFVSTLPALGEGGERGAARHVVRDTETGARLFRATSVSDADAAGAAWARVAWRPGVLRWAAFDAARGDHGVLGVLAYGSDTQALSHVVLARRDELPAEGPEAASRLMVSDRPVTWRGHDASECRWDEEPGSPDNPATLDTGAGAAEPVSGFSVCVWTESAVVVASVPIVGDRLAPASAIVDTAYVLRPE